METNYTYLDAYSSFLLREAYNQEKFAVCINEAVLLAEGAPAEEFHIIHEAFTDKIKELWNKFVTFINKIWMKFKAYFDKLLDNDKGWVEKYKAIITQQPLKLNISMRNYQATLISQMHAEHFDPAKLETLKAGDMLTYAKSIQGVSNLLSGHNGSTELGDIRETITVALYGGSMDEKELTNINMTDVYNFVHDYKDTIAKDIENDKNAIIKSAANFDKLLKELEAQAKAAQAEAEVNNAENNNGNGTPPTGNNTPPTPAQGAVGNENAIFLNMPFKTLNEIQLTDKSTTPTNKANMAGGVSTPSNTKFSTNQKGLSGTAVSKDNINAANVDTKLSTDTAAMEKITSTYTQVNQMLMTVKADVCTKMYKDYKAIITAHINSYVGEKQNLGVGARGTNYQANQPQGTPGNPNPTPAPAAPGIVQ